VQSEAIKQPSFWSKPSVEWALTLLLSVIFFMAFGVYLIANFINDDLLNPALYTQTLTENDIYDRVYTELLADPALQDTTKLLLGNVNIDTGTTDWSPTSPEKVPHQPGPRSCRS
jgi:hypothetical protein